VAEMKKVGFSLVLRALPPGHLDVQPTTACRGANQLE
jgi:hypothetical protein